jgi:ADP-heptose:LPS heptosyltransferase
VTRIVVLRALGLGDLLTAVPALRALRAAFPSATITLATPAALAPLALLTGAVDEVVDTAPLAPLDPASAGADLAVNLHGRGPESTRLLAATNPGRLIAFGFDGRGWRAEEHEVRRWCRLLTESGIPADPSDLDLALPPVPSRAPGAVVLHPGAASESRRWPVDRWAEVGRAVAATDRRVVVTGSTPEIELAAEVGLRAGLPPESLLAGRTGLLELAALVAGAHRVVCGDTGVAHLATAYRTPSVLLFGPTPPARWGPPADRPRHTVLWAGLAGDPHGNTPDAGLLQISVAEVLAALRRGEANGR